MSLTRVFKISVLPHYIYGHETPKIHLLNLMNCWTIVPILIPCTRSPIPGKEAWCLVERISCLNAIISLRLLYDLSVRIGTNVGHIMICVPDMCSKIGTHIGARETSKLCSQPRSTTSPGPKRSVRYEPNLMWGIKAMRPCQDAPHLDPPLSNGWRDNSSQLRHFFKNLQEPG